MEQKAKTARQRAREEITEEILTAARTQLTRRGPGELSLRGVARDVGMVSSAVYRYFASRDELLTALLIEGYDSLGQAAEDADHSIADRADIRARWSEVCRAIRTWSIDHPGDYALLYGSPVPGYAAPQDTVVPATRCVTVMISIVAAAHAAGDVRAPVTPAAAPPGTESTVAPAMEFVNMHDELDVPVDAEIAMRTVMAWTTIFGTISFELFGHLVGSVSSYESYFDQVAARLGDDLGIL